MAIKRYRKDGEYVICSPECVGDYEKEGYTLRENPIKEESIEGDGEPEPVEGEPEPAEKKHKGKK